MSKQYENFTAEIVFSCHKTGHYYEALLKCTTTDIIYYYRGHSFHYDYSMGDVVTFDAKIKKKRRKPIKFKKLGLWKYDNRIFEFEYLHDLWYPKNIKKMEEN